MLDVDEVQYLLRWRQDGIIARRQIIELGGCDDDIRRMLRRRELTQVHPGVYVNHTGQLSRVQREWAAVLYYWPAVLAGDSALPDPTDRRIHIAVGLERRVQSRKGIVVHRTADLETRADWRAGPPRIYRELAVIAVMADHLKRDDVAEAFAVLARACHRSTSAEQVHAALNFLPRVPHRKLLAALITDRRDGACSVLERGWLHLERTHGLPKGERQATSLATGHRTDQDVRYQEYGVVVELDGRGFHDSPEARDHDARRDLAELAIADALTARVTHGLVFRDGCRTTLWVARILWKQGWRDDFKRCPKCPPPR